MKMIQRITTALAGAAVFAAVSTAQAQVNIYITGSTAFRGNAFRAIVNMYGANLTSQNPTSGGSSAGRITWTGTIPALYAAQTVTVHANYSGSVEGIQALVQNLDDVFFASATDGDSTLVTNKDDLAFSDVFQGATAYKSPALLPTSASANEVGVQPFVWVRSAATPSAVSNIGPAQYFTLLANGQDDLSNLTGNPADAGNPIYLVGRYNLSGTRLTIEKCCKFPPASGLLYAPDTNCNWNLSAGFVSGGGIVTVFSNNVCTATGTGTPALTYLGIGDAKNAVAGGAIVIGGDGELPYTGLITSPDFSPTKNGLYNFWGYEHLYYKSGASANVTTFHTNLKSAINTDLGASPGNQTAIRLSDMNVSRPSDGGPISP
ncbi:MAG TPA: hypothetical protein VLU94_01180 [Candidatus Nitrosotalea sp.]|nr:hypothetical protein [Candidatus Nitrosotalea sp.]